MQRWLLLTSPGHVVLRRGSSRVFLRVMTGGLLSILVGGNCMKVVIAVAGVLLLTTTRQLLSRPRQKRNAFAAWTLRKSAVTGCRGPAWSKDAAICGWRRHLAADHGTADVGSSAVVMFERSGLFVTHTDALQTHPAKSPRDLT